MPNRIMPVGRMRKPGKKTSGNEFLWSEKTPDGDNEFGTVTLNPGMFHGEPLVIESFGLGSSHAFRRKF